MGAMYSIHRRNLAVISLITVSCSDPGSASSADVGLGAACDPARDANNALGLAKKRGGAVASCPTTPPLFLDCTWLGPSSPSAASCTATFKGSSGGECKGKYGDDAVTALGSYDVRKDRSVCGFITIVGIPSSVTCDYDLLCQ